MPRTRILTLAATAAAALLAGSGIAQAHITANPSLTAPNSYSVVTFQVPHGCKDAPTTRVAITIPEDILVVKPTVNQGWDLSLTKQPVNPPVVGGHGHTITERVSQVTYTAKTPLPSAYRDAFELLVKLPDGAPGTVVRFPTTQTCTVGETAWTDIPAPGADPHSVAHPAPMVTLTAGDGDAHGHGHGHGDSHGKPDLFRQLSAMFGSS